MPPTTKTKKTISAAELERRKKQGKAQKKSSKTTRGGGWRKGADLQPQELDLPSGATCLVAQPGVEVLVKTGVIDQVDVLTPLVDEKLVKPARNAGEMPTINTAALTPEHLVAIYELADRITCAVVVDPPVLLAPMPKCSVCAWEDINAKTHKPADGHELQLIPRDPDAFYTDGIASEDKFAILNFALGGPQSVASFLGESNEGVEDVPASEDVAGDAQPDTGTGE